MLQSLHLDGAERPVAVLCEGPALRLRRHGIADVFAPLPSLGRVTVHGTGVHWRTEALMACLEAGVPVLFHGGRGEWLGTLLPARVPTVRRELAGLLDMAASVPGFRHRLENFIRAEEQTALRAVCQEGPSRRVLDRVAGPATAFTPAGLRRAVLMHAPRPLAAEAAWRFLAGLASGMVAAELARRGVGPRFLMRRTGGFALSEELGRVLAWRFVPRIAGLSRLVVLDENGALDARSRRLLIHAFERAELAPERDRLLARLAGLLADTV